MTEEDDVPLEEGMPVVNEDGDELGTLSALLVAEDDADDTEGEAEFLLLRVGTSDRLVPFDAVLGVGDGSLVLDVPKDNVAKFPAIAEGKDPTDKEMERAYAVFDEGATGGVDDDGE